MIRRTIIFPICIVLLSCLCAPQAQSQRKKKKNPFKEVIVRLKNGRFQEVNIISMDKTSITWSDPKKGGVFKLPFESIDQIEFPETEAVAAARKDYEAGRYKAAATKYRAVFTDKTARTYYPAPGNFSAIAHVRLLECYRRLLMPFEVATYYKQVDWKKIPKKEQADRAVTEIWALAGVEKWELILEKTDEARKNMDWTDPLRAEVAFLRGLAYEGKDDVKNATAAFGEAYGAYPGVSLPISKKAIAKSAGFLIDQPDHKQELVAIVHLYAGMYGNGQLWEGADPNLTALLAKPLEAPRTQ